MLGKYAYSLTGVSWTGSFESREEAAANAIEAARRAVTSPTTVYVGKMVEADPKASGHARAVLANMGTRAREEFGDAASDYMRNLPKDRIEELDDALELVVRGWLSRNELLPRFFKVEAISEHPVLNAPHFRYGQDAREVNEIGAGDYE